MQLYYIRHAESANNELFARTRSWEGRSDDPELTPLGCQQANALADFLSSGNPDGGVNSPDQPSIGFGLTHLYTSLMLRSISTAEVTAKKLNLPLVARLDLHEIGGVVYRDPLTDVRTGRPGKNRPYFQDRFPKLILPEEVGEAGWWNRPAETEAEILPRAQRLLDWLQQTHGNSDDRVAFFSHGAFFKVFLSALFGLDHLLPISTALNNASISRFDFEEERIRLRYINRMDFLPSAWITF